ncbi:hypothetical protein RB595_004517 [Gaeumannomyces hyphopodioides]
MSPITSWAGDAEKEMLLALWHSASIGPLKPDWTKAVAIMEARGFGFTLEAIKSRWFKKILKEYRALEGPEGAAKAGPSGKRKRVDDGDAAPSTPKKTIATGLKTPVSKRAKTPQSGAIKSEPADIPYGSDHGQQDESSPEPSPTARVRRSNPCRLATKSGSYKESAEEEGFSDDSDAVV